MSNPIGLITSRITDRLLKNQERRIVDTPFGNANVVTGLVGGKEVVAINRYGDEQRIPAHRVNYKANIWALRILGVTRVISQNAIGSMNPILKPGDVVIPHDFIDHTKNRPLSLFENDECWVRVDMGEPFCQEMRNCFISETKKLTDRFAPYGVFVCVEGPRFETPAEIQLFQMEGGDIIGTPLIPEAIMAREAELCYASIAPIMNFAAGLAPQIIHSGKDGIIAEYYKGGLHELVEDIIVQTIGVLPSERGCKCSSYLQSGFHGVMPEWFTQRC